MITFIFLAPTLDFVSSVFYVNESDGTVVNVVCMTLTPPTGGLECDVVVPLTLVDGKASELPNIKLLVMCIYVYVTYIHRVWHGLCT